MMERWELPKGWEWKKVGEVAQDTERRNPSLRPDESFSYVDIAAIDNKNYCIRLECVKKIKGKDAPSRARKVIHANDVIFATTRPYLKNIAIVPQALDNQICSTGFCVLRAKPGMAIPKYLFFAVLTNSFIHQLTPKGANYPAVNDSDIYQAIIPIPYSDDPARSLAEQRRIVARLELLLGETRAMREDIQAMHRDLAQVMDSVLAEVFPNPNGKMPRGWGWRRLGDIAPEDSQQIFPTDYPGHLFNYWGLDATEKGQIDEPAPNFVAGSSIKSACIKFTSEHVLYCKLRPYLNKVIVPSLEGIGSTEWVPLRPDPEIIERKFLAFALRTPQFVQYATSNVAGARMPRMSKRALEETKIPIPYLDDPARSLAEQRRIVARLELLLGETRAMREDIQAMHRDLAQVMDSVLAEVFPNPNGKMPRGWGWRRLGDIAPEDSQQIFPTDYPGHLFNYWGLDATEKGQIDEPAPNFVAGSSIKSACIKFTSEHVLYCKLRPYLNKVIVPSLEGIGSTEWVPLRPDPEIIERKFLAFALRTPQFVQYATSNVAGARMPRMSKRALEETKIPIPYLDDPARSLAEQRRIVARLELLLGETRAMREDIQAIHRDLAQVMDSVLAEVFPNPNGKMPRGWGWKSIDDLFELQQGASMSPRRRQGRNPQPFLRTKNILWGEVDTSDVDVMDFTEDEIERLKLRKGDLLICEGGDVGRAAVWEDQLPLVMYQNHIHRLRRKSEDIDPKFYVYWMKAAYQLFKIYQGEESRTAIPNLSGRRLKNFLVPTTSLTEQHCIVACLEHIAEEIRAMDDRLAQDLRDIEALDQSILAAAFRGEV